MKVTISHKRPKAEVVASIDRAINDLLRSPENIPAKILVQQKEWQGSTLAFALTAKMGFFSTPIKGTVEVTDADIIIDADLGMLENMIPADKARDVIKDRIQGLLN